MEKTQISFIKKLMLRKDRQYIIFFDRRTGITDEKIQFLIDTLVDMGYQKIIAARVDDVDGIRVIEKIK